MSRKKRFSLIFLVIALLVLQPLAAFACATCGCSELCPLCMVRDTETNGKKQLPLSDSLWGSIILKMAYQRDPEIQKLARHMRRVNMLTGGAFFTAVSGTLAQNTISLAVLNQDQGNDSYLPGSLGLGLSSLMMLSFDGSMLMGWRLQKKLKVRQLAIKEKVEGLLNHLEFSASACPDAQKDLAEMIGQEGAADCLKLWGLAHSQIASSGQSTSMLDKSTTPDQEQLPQVELKSTPLKLVTSQK